MKKKIIPFIIGALMLTGCDDLFSPAIENFQGVENMYNDAEYARGNITMYTVRFRAITITASMARMTP